MNNYYPLTKNKYDLEFLVTRWKANGLFQNISDINILNLLMWHTTHKYIQPFITEEDNKILIHIWGVHENNGRLKISASNLKGATPRLWMDNLDKKNHIKDSLGAYQVYLSREDITMIESGKPTHNTKSKSDNELTGTPLEHLNRLKNLISLWSADINIDYEFKLDIKDGNERIIIPLSGVEIMSELKKYPEFDGIGKGQNVTNQPFWKSKERQKICILKPSKEGKRKILSKA